MTASKAFRPSGEPEPGPDLSARIVGAVDKSRFEQVTCRRVTDNCYRCNWWMPQNLKGYDNPGMKGLLVTTSRISRSRFLYVILTDEGQLKITAVGGESVPQRE